MADAQTLSAMVRAKYPGVYDDLSDAELDTKIRAKFPGVYDDLPKPPNQVTPPVKETQSSSAALPLAAASIAAPRAAGWAMELATNPDAWKTGATIGRVVGGLSAGGGAVAAGLASGHPMTVLSAPAAAAMGSWVGGKEGWRTMNLAQKLAGKAVPALEAAGPMLAAASGAMSVGDLAQMADPTRTDIGLLGIGAHHDPINPKDVPLVNEGIAKVFDHLGRPDLAKLWRGE